MTSAPSWMRSELCLWNKAAFGKKLPKQALEKATASEKAGALDLILFQGQRELQDWKQGRQQVPCLCSLAVQGCIFGPRFLGVSKHGQPQVCQPGGYPLLTVFSLHLLEYEGQPFPRLLLCGFARALKPAKVMQQTTQEVTVEPLAKQDMQGVTPDHMAADPWQLEQLMLTPGLCLALSMTVQPEVSLFQGYLLELFSKSSISKVLSITFPTRVM